MTMGRANFIFEMLLVLLCWGIVISTDNVYPYTSAYNCESDKSGMTAYDNDLSKMCDSIEEDANTGINTEEIHVQILNQDFMRKVEVFQCQVKYVAIVQHCGMHSHTSPVKVSFGNGYQPKYLTRSECMDLQKTGVYTYHGMRIEGVRRNDTTKIILRIIIGNVVLLGILTSNLNYISISFA